LEYVNRVIVRCGKICFFHPEIKKPNLHANQHSTEGQNGRMVQLGHAVFASNMPDGTQLEAHSGLKMRAEKDVKAALATNWTNLERTKRWLKRSGSWWRWSH
jgi:hypothetical protein